MSNRIIVTDYNPEWPVIFEQLRAKIWPAISDLAMAMEHVGSTSVPGLAAKPVIDVDIIIESKEALGTAIKTLAMLGYQHRGNLGIEGRDSFSVPAGSVKHNLYVCIKDCLAVRNHLALRDRLRKDPEARKKYGDLKKDLAQRHPDSIDLYVEGKTAFILSMLEENGIESAELEKVRQSNLAPQNKVGR